MSLKQSIVIVNEFTYKTGYKSGSRGGTPGEYIRRYMSRENAVEAVTPVRKLESDGYFERYLLREQAADSSENAFSFKHKMRNLQTKGGTAFGYGEVSLSEEKLKAASKDIQYQFDNGKTVFKTVLSFDEEYLLKYGLLDSDFVFKKRGDFRGHIDQLKLRMAIMKGIKRMSRYYDDLQYVGCIQVDTKHIHCHLAMVDRGTGHLRKDGTQRGKLNGREMKALRRGIDLWLDEKQTVKMMSSSVLYDKQNALCYVKKLTYKTMKEQGLPQFLIACLPEDRRLWRASTNRTEMRKANALVREYVVQLLEEPNSGYRDAMNSVFQYASMRQEREGLSADEYAGLVRSGQERLVQDCMNGVYSVLKQIPDEQLKVRTPMLETMSLDYDEMASLAAHDPMVEFGFRLRSYSSRLQHHKKEYHKYRDVYRNYERSENKSEDSAALGNFFKVERDYNAMLMTKYQYFLTFLDSDDSIEEDMQAYLDAKDNLDNLKMMYEDPAFAKMKPDTAEEYGLSVYGQYGGRRVKTMPSIIQRRITLLQESVNEKEQAFRDKLRDVGLDYDGTGIIKKKMYPFSDVKALDLHHLGYDFAYNAPISKVNVDVFCDMAEERYGAFVKAKDYLVRSGQAYTVQSLPEKDVLFMKEYADKLRVNPVLVTTRPSGGKKRLARTVALDTDYLQDMKTVVQSSIRSAQME